MTERVILDIILAAIIVVTAVLGAKRGFFKSISGIAGTVMGFIAARTFAAPAAVFIAKPITPWFYSLFSKASTQAAFASAAENAAQGINSFCETLLASGIPKFLAELTKDALSSMSGGLSEFAAKYSDPEYIRILAEGAAAALSPIIAFILLYVAVRLLVALVCRILSGNIPVLRTVNRTAGFVLGLVSGLLIVILLCWGFRAFAPEAGGMLSLDTLSKTIIGGFILKLLW